MAIEIIQLNKRLRGTPDTLVLNPAILPDTKEAVADIFRRTYRAAHVPPEARAQLLENIDATFDNIFDDKDSVPLAKNLVRVASELWKTRINRQ